MSEQLDKTLQAMAELTNAVKAAKQPKQDLQWDEIKAKFATELETMVAEQVKAQRVAGAPIGVNGELKNNRYSRFVKSFEKDGTYNHAGQVLKPIDLVIAERILSGQLKHWNAQMGPAAFGPSNDLQLAIKAMDSTTATAGDELVPTNMSATLWEDFFLASRVVNALQRVAMPTNPFDIPLGLGNVAWRKGTENVATTASNPATGKSTLTVTEMVTEQAWSYTLDEDAVIAMAPAIRARLAQSGAEQMDAFALNADNTASATGNINLDDATPPADSYYLSDGQDGIRHFWLVDAATPMGLDTNGALEDADIIGELGHMGKYGADPSRLIIVCDVNTYLAGFLSAATAAPGNNTITIDKFGPQAVVLTGQLAAYRGIPLVVSASHPLTEADGKASVTAASNTKGSLSIVNRDMWYVGFIRDLMIEVDRDIQRRQYVMVTSMREAIGARSRAATDTHTGGVFNITV